MSEKKICFLTYNFPRDYALAAALHANLYDRYVAEADFVWCIESKHAGVPLPPGVEALVEDFNRGGSLRYTEALHAMSRVFARLSEKYSVIVKIDADTYLREPERWTDYIAGGGDLAYIPHLQTRGGGNGCCYALSARAAAHFPLISPEAFDARAHDAHGREDLFFTTAVSASEESYVAMIPRNRVSWCDIAAQPGTRAVAAHLGYLSDADVCERVAEISGEEFPFFPESDYAKRVAVFCAEHGIEIGTRKRLFDLKGNKVYVPEGTARVQSVKGIKIR